MKLLPSKPTIKDFITFWSVQSRLSLIAVLLTIICSAVLWLRLSSTKWNSTTKSFKWNILGTLVAIVVLGVTYYPLTKGHHLGQIQVFLGALAALALLLQQFRHRALSGACLGLCCLIKGIAALISFQHTLFHDSSRLTTDLFCFALLPY